MKTSGIIVLLQLWSFLLAGQTIEPFALVSNANYYDLSVQGLSLHTSLGELSTEHLDAENTHLSQGFLQTYFEDIVSTEEGSSEALRLTVGPNPFTERVTLRVAPATDLEGQLYDVYGRLLLTLSLNDGATEIDGTKLPAGTYLLRVGQSGQTLFSTIKLIKL